MTVDKNVPATHRDQLPDHENRIADLLGGMANIANSIAEAGGVAGMFPFIGINNDGIWAFGPDRIEVEQNSHWAIDIRTWQHGYIAWPPADAKERKPLGERMVPASSALPVMTSLPDVGAKWQLQFAFELLCLTGADTGVMALYKNGSYGAKVLVQNMVDEVRKQARLDPTKLCPVVILDIRSYVHKEWKKTIYNPVLQIQKWISFEEFDNIEKLVPVEETAPAPAAEPARGRPAEPVAAARGNGRRTAVQTPIPTPRRPGRTQPRA